MQTYKYQIPADGRFAAEFNSSAEQWEENVKENLEFSLRHGESCLASYCMFPTDSDILDRVSFEKNEDGHVTAINLHTYTELWEGRENDLIECVTAVQNTVSADLGDEDVMDNYLNVNEDAKVTALGREGDVPKTLYHITECRNVYDMEKNGIIPSVGPNHYKDDEPHVYLCEEKDLSMWLTVLKNNKDVAVMEVNTEGLDGIETGRAFRDRKFIGRFQGQDYASYIEYRTFDAIPAANVKEADITSDNELGARLASDMAIYMKNTENAFEFAEVKTGINRLVDMGVMYTEAADRMIWAQEGEIQKYEDNKVRQQEKASEAWKAEHPDAGDDNGKAPFNEEDEDFASAIGEMRQMGLSDYGINAD